LVFSSTTGREACCISQDFVPSSSRTLYFQSFFKYRSSVELLLTEPWEKVEMPVPLPRPTKSAGVK
jgi:hypothetical protein